jgi:hypothetical protein
MHEPTLQLKYAIYYFAIYPEPCTEAQQCPQPPIAKRRMLFDQAPKALDQNFVQPRRDPRAYRARPQAGTGKVQQATHFA